VDRCAAGDCGRAKRDSLGRPRDPQPRSGRRSPAPVAANRGRSQRQWRVGLAAVRTIRRRPRRTGTASTLAARTSGSHRATVRAGAGQARRRRAESGDVRPEARARQSAHRFGCPREGVHAGRCSGRAFQAASSSVTNPSRVSSRSAARTSRSPRIPSIAQAQIPPSNRPTGGATPRQEAGPPGFGFGGDKAAFRQARA
jgi:hypothetical protein